MKKLAALQIVVGGMGYVLCTWLGMALWHIAVFVWLPIVVGGYVWFWWFRNVYFFRDPKRVIPLGDDVIVAPADGRVMYLYPVKGGEITSDKQGTRIRIDELAKTPIADSQGWLLGMYLSPFDVHYNRAPIQGEIRTIHYHQTGVNLPMVDLWEYVNFVLFRRAINLFSAPFHLENERMTMQIQNSRLTCVVILIADKFVNKISRFFQDGQQVEKGQKISFIERGSQTDLFIPDPDLVFLVKPGEQVYAGETIIARIPQENVPGLPKG